MTAQPTTHRLAEMRRDIVRLLDDIQDGVTDAVVAGDASEVAALHRAVAGVVRRMQERARSKGGDVVVAKDAAQSESLSIDGGS